MRQTSKVVFCAIDTFVLPGGKIDSGFANFSGALDDAGIPSVWVTSRSRAQMDEPRRKLGHNHPFIAEDGCGVYLPEDYFHLRPAKTTRLGRFTCIPIAQPQPVASQALESLCESTGVAAVALSSLSPREYAQNSGLNAREAALARQRDFEELFFFAGASGQQVTRFVAEGQRRNLQLREGGVIWSLAAGANLRQCVRELSKLYDRAVRSHLTLLGIDTARPSDDLLGACDRGVLLEDESVPDSSAAQARSPKVKAIPKFEVDTWERLLAAIAPSA